VCVFCNPSLDQAKQKRLWFNSLDLQGRLLNELQIMNESIILDHTWEQQKCWIQRVLDLKIRWTLFRKVTKRTKNMMNSIMLNDFESVWSYLSTKVEDCDDLTSKVFSFVFTGSTRFCVWSDEVINCFVIKVS